MVLKRYGPPRQPVTVTIRYQLPKSWAAMERRLAELAADGGLVQAILRQALAETILLLYRERFLAGLPGAVAMEREAAGAPSLRDSPTVRIRRAKLRARLQEAYASQDDDRVQQLIAAEQKFASELRLRRRRAPTLPSGRFRLLALQVLRVVADATQIQDAGSGGGMVRLGVGRLSFLERIETPSATPVLRGYPTSSKFSTLWRHLEFGTGIYSSISSVNAGSPYRLPGGGWWYGRSPQEALRLRGSRGVHALRQASGAPYAQDAVLFRERVQQLLARALFGR